MNLIEQARAAWRQNDLNTAQALALKAFNEDRSADNACFLAQVLYGAGRSGEARNILRSAIAELPWYLPAQAQLGRMIKMDARATADATRKELAERATFLAATRATLDRDPFFKPSVFWTDIAIKHERMLDHFGIENFKRTVAHNYQNWLIASSDDPQWIRLREIWKSEPSDQPLLNTVENADDAGFIWDEAAPTYPLSNPTRMAIYKLAVGIAWEFSLARDPFGFLAGFEESTIGNPIRLRRDGVLISQDAAHSSRELNTLWSALGNCTDGPLTFAELGAGHGRLAEMIGRKTKHRYLIFDISPTLFVSQWYIQNLFPDERIFAFRDFESWSDVADEVNASRFAFFTPNQIKFLPDASVDVFINICSLMEMRKAQIEYFLRRIAEITRVAFMSKQYYRWHNAADDIVLTKDDFKIGNGFSIAHDSTDDIHNDLFVQIWKR
jgi:putative sugar O-methyltransferase